MSAPMIGRITRAEDARSGKSVRVQIDGKWYNSKLWELKDMVGQTISFTPETSHYQGKSYEWVNDYMPGADAAPPAGQPEPPPANYPPANQQYPTQTAPVPPQLPNTPDPMALLPITSNITAHVISAGHINKPEELRTWMRTAFNVANSLFTDDFDDDIPF